MPPSEECEEALRNYEEAKVAFDYASTAYLLSDPGPQRERAHDRLQRRRRELDEAIDRVAAVCGERVTIIETGDGEGDRLELRCHPLVPDERERRVKEILDRIPENHKRGLRRITLHVKQPPPGEGGGEAGGQKAADYSRDDKAIGHYHPNEVASIKHEIGHHVYFDRLNAEARRRWERFFERNKTAMPTEYGRTEAKEGFAEVYEFYYDRKDLDPAVKAEFEAIIALVP
jgi:hypothetical protein